MTGADLGGGVIATPAGVLRRRAGTRLGFLAVLCALACLGTPALAGQARAAGSYTVLSCRGPGGTGTGVLGDSRNGWQPFTNADPATTSLDNACSSADPNFDLIFGGQSPGQQTGANVPCCPYAQWVFVAPPDTSIAAYRIDWLGSVHAGVQAEILRSDRQITAQHGGSGPETWGSPTAPESITGSGPAAAVGVRVGCMDQNGCVDSAAPLGQVQVQRSFMALTDPNAPVVTSPGGPAVSDATWRGNEAVSFGATDRGGGVYRLLWQIDGQTVAAQPADPGNAQCVDADPTNSNPYEFLYPLPCAGQVSVNAGLDTTTIPDGRHSMRLLVEDAAGNQATVFSADKTVSNGAPTAAVNGGARASGHVRLTASFPRRRTRLTVSAGRRVRVTGRLVDAASGHPIPGAVLDIAARASASNAPYASVGIVRTSSDGSYGFVVTPGPSRLVVVNYRLHTGDPKPVGSAAVRLNVRARATLQVSPGVVRAGRSIRVSGRLIGRPVPRGVVVVLQAFYRHQWQAFAAPTASADGSFHATHALAAGLPPGRYALRAVIPRNAAYPYVRGYSKIVYLTVRR